MGIAALPAYVCRSELRSRQLTRILPGWLAGESTFTALLPYRLGLSPAVRFFVDYLALQLPECVQLGGQCSDEVGGRQRLDQAH